MQELVGKITGSANDAAGQAKGAASDAAGSAKGAVGSAQGAGKEVAKKAPVSTLTFALANPAGNAQVQSSLRAGCKRSAVSAYPTLCQSHCQEPSSMACKCSLDLCSQPRTAICSNALPLGPA